MIAEKINRYNLKYAANSNNGTLRKTPNYRLSVPQTFFYKQARPILISAPHAVRQMNKAADVLTGGLAEYLARECRCYCLTRTGNRQDNPNRDLTGPGMEYKNTLVSVVETQGIRYLLDLHACQNREDFAFCLGTSGGENLNGDTRFLHQLRNALEPLGHVSIDVPFAAAKRTNVSHHVAAATGIPCIQLEISARFRSLRDPRPMEELAQALSSVLCRLAPLEQTDSAPTPTLRERLTM